MPRLLRAGAALLACGVCLLLPASAAAVTVTLTGETLTANPFASTPDVTCSSPGGPHTASYQVVGTAEGPYPGTFTETGTVTFLDGAVISSSADFTIDSANGTVTGHKTFVPGSTTIATCVDEAGETRADLLFRESYTATIDGPLGSFSESGFATTNVHPHEVPLNDNVAFQQTFTSSGLIGAQVVEVTPATAINPIGTLHTVTAIVRTVTGDPIQGANLIFAINPTGGTSRCGPTNAQGECSITYAGPDFPQADEISACVDENDNGLQDPGEPCGFASKVWTAPATTTGQVMGGGFIGGSRMSVAIGAKARTLTEPPSGHCNANDHIARIRIRCLEITTMILTPTHATLFGDAEQDGVATSFRIDVDDLSDLGSPDTFTITTGLGYSNGGPLTGGNIQIRP